MQERILIIGTVFGVSVFVKLVFQVQVLPSRDRALAKTKSFLMIAVIATFSGFPDLINLSYFLFAAEIMTNDAVRRHVHCPKEKARPRPYQVAATCDKLVPESW